MINFFTLFSLPEQYDLDLKTLEQRYFDLQKEFHPDRVKGKTEAEKMALIRKSADINQGYRTLKNSVTRAEHLLEINNILVNKEKNNTHKPSQALLMEQMELREKASDIESGMENKAELLSHINSELDGTKKEFSSFFEQKNLNEAAQTAMKMKYLLKLKDEIRKF